MSVFYSVCFAVVIWGMVQEHGIGGTIALFIALLGLIAIAGAILFGGAFLLAS